MACLLILIGFVLAIVLLGIIGAIIGGSDDDLTPPAVTEPVGLDCPAGRPCRHRQRPPPRSGAWPPPTPRKSRFWASKRPETAKNRPFSVFLALFCLFWFDLGLFPATFESIRVHSRFNPLP